ncbi:RNA methyltransferase [Elioraea thermophila]|uniref:RNA methyltransferase n=1 Tax=Elioraea thermophila TaxID=2185104 RepID=UPI000DF3D7D0|nr:RNA methyltransferase [Elioraea thermophila]
MDHTPRGWFAIGMEGVSKPGNAGALLRTAHAFGAAFLFAVGDSPGVAATRATDTSDATRHVPFYRWPDPGSLVLPRLCRLVGVELTEEAIPLPSFHHPLQAAYVFGPERGSLSPAMLARCDWVVRIPTRFALNLAVAGAIVMYDRLMALGRFAPRPVSPTAAPEPPPSHRHGRPRFRRGTPPLLAADEGEGGGGGGVA